MLFKKITIIYYKMKSIYDLQVFDISSDDVDFTFVITIYGKTLDNRDIVLQILNHFSMLKFQNYGILLRLIMNLYLY